MVASGFDDAPQMAEHLKMWLEVCLATRRSRRFQEQHPCVWADLCCGCAVTVGYQNGRMEADIDVFKCGVDVIEPHILPMPLSV